MFSKILPVTLPLLLVALPHLATAQTNATLTQYLTSSSCPSTTSTIIATISQNQCLNTGSEEAFASIAFSNLLGAEDGSTCFGEIYQFAGCGTSSGDPTAGSYWRQGPVTAGDSEVCFGDLVWANGQEGLGSAMLVCE